MFWLLFLIGLVHLCGGNSSVNLFVIVVNDMLFRLIGSNWLWFIHLKATDFFIMNLSPAMLLTSDYLGFLVHSRRFPRNTFERFSNSSCLNFLSIFVSLLVFASPSGSAGVSRTARIPGVTPAVTTWFPALGGWSRNSGFGLKQINLADYTSMYYLYLIIWLCQKIWTLFQNLRRSHSAQPWFLL